MPSALSLSLSLSTTHLPGAWLACGSSPAHVHETRTHTNIASMSLTSERRESSGKFEVNVFSFHNWCCYYGRYYRTTRGHFSPRKPKKQISEFCHPPHRKGSRKTTRTHHNNQKDFYRIGLLNGGLNCCHQAGELGALAPGTHGSGPGQVWAPSRWRVSSSSPWLLREEPRGPRLLRPSGGRRSGRGQAKLKPTFYYFANVNKRGRSHVRTAGWICTHAHTFL